MFERELDLSDFDHPAVVRLWAWAGQRLGDSLVALRLPSDLSHTVALVLGPLRIAA